MLYTYIVLFKKTKVLLTFFIFISFSECWKSTHCFNFFICFYTPYIQQPQKKKREREGKKKDSPYHHYLYISIFFFLNCKIPRRKESWQSVLCTISNDFISKFKGNNQGITRIYWEFHLHTSHTHKHTHSYTCKQPHTHIYTCTQKPIKHTYNYLTRKGASYTSMQVNTSKNSWSKNIQKIHERPYGELVYEHAILHCQLTWYNTTAATTTTMLLQPPPGYSISKWHRTCKKTLKILIRCYRITSCPVPNIKK